MELVRNIFILLMWTLKYVRTSGDHRGREFLLSFMKNGYGNGKPYVNIVTGSNPAVVTLINHWTSATPSHNIAASSSLQIELHSSIRYVSEVEANETKSVTILSTSDVSVYVLDYNTYSSEGYLAIPVPYLSTRYIAVSYTEKSQYLPNILITAVEDETEVSVTLRIQDGGTCTSNNHVTGDSVSFVLKANEVVGIFCTKDLTGTFIQSDKPVTLISGHPCAEVPSGTGGVDMLTEMIVPVEALGSKFLLHDLAGRDSGAIYRVVASQDKTEIDTSNGASYSLDFGAFVDIDTAVDGEMCLTSSKPVLVMMYGKGKQADLVPPDGDAFMAQVPPEERYMNEYAYDPSLLSGFTSYFAKSVPNTYTPMSSETRVLIGCDHLVDVGNVTSAYVSESIIGQAIGAVVYGFMSAGGYGFPLGLIFDLDECSSAPCVNNGTCTDLVYGFNCTCMEGFTGDTCHTVIIDSSLASLTTETPSSITDSIPTSPTDTLSLISVTSASLSPSQLKSTTTSSTAYSSTQSLQPLLDLSLMSSFESSISETYIMGFSSEFLIPAIEVSTDITENFVSTEFSQYTTEIVQPSSVVDAANSTISTMVQSLTSYSQEMSLTLPALATSSVSLQDLGVSSKIFTSYVFTPPSSLVQPVINPSASSPEASQELPTNILISTLSSMAEIAPTSISQISTSINPSSSTPSSTSTSSAHPSTSSSTSISTPTPSSTSTSSELCRCGCKRNLSEAETEELVKLLKKSLTIPTSTLSSTIRRKTSAQDNRPTSVAMGSSGIVIIVLVLVLMSVADIAELVAYFLCSKRTSTKSVDTLILQR